MTLTSRRLPLPCAPAALAAGADPLVERGVETGGSGPDARSGCAGPDRGPTAARHGRRAAALQGAMTGQGTGGRPRCSTSWRAVRCSVDWPSRADRHPDRAGSRAVPARSAQRTRDRLEDRGRRFPVKAMRAVPSDRTSLMLPRRDDSVLFQDIRIACLKTYASPDVIFGGHVIEGPSGDHRGRPRGLLPTRGRPRLRGVPAVDLPAGGPLPDRRRNRIHPTLTPAHAVSHRPRTPPRLST
jgi:hypothetical protein